MRKLTYLLTVAVFLCRPVLGQSPQINASQMSQEDLQKYVPILPSVKARFWPVDPKLGYGVKSVGGGVYVVSDQMWQSAFLVTDEGVIVFDAPESFGNVATNPYKKRQGTCEQQCSHEDSKRGPERVRSCGLIADQSRA